MLRSLASVVRARCAFDILEESVCRKYGTAAGLRGDLLSSTPLFRIKLVFLALSTGRDGFRLLDCLCEVSGLSGSKWPSMHVQSLITIRILSSIDPPAA
jgi:hypothetical protein